MERVWFCWGICRIGEREEGYNIRANAGHVVVREHFCASKVVLCSDSGGKDRGINVLDNLGRKSAHVGGKSRERKGETNVVKRVVRSVEDGDGRPNGSNELVVVAPLKVGNLSKESSG